MHLVPHPTHINYNFQAGILTLISGKEKYPIEKYSFKVITCEHNFAPQRKQIHDLLLAKGYWQKTIRGDQSDFEDWYVKS